MSQDLSQKAGIPIRLDQEKMLIKFEEDLRRITPDVRRLSQAREVLFSPSVETDEDLYFMYRGVGREKEIDILQRHNLRYDLTLLKPLLIGREYNKTVGHYHPEAGDSHITYPEVYEVITGEAHYLLQKVTAGPEGQVVEQAFVVEAHPGDKVLIPPGYGHITINPDLNEPLLMANITASGFKSIYEPIKEMRGGAYFELGDGQWIKNSHYLKVADLNFVKAFEHQAIGLTGQMPLYSSCVQGASSFRYLTHPFEYTGLWKEIEKRLRS